MAPPKPLFDDDEAQPAEAELRVNQDFAKRFEHNKKREELHRLQEKYPEEVAKLAKERVRAAGGSAATAAAKGGDEEESSSDDDDEDPEKIISDKTQAQIFETLLKIRARDQSIYQPDTKFYSSSSDDEEEEEAAAAGKKGKKEKPMFLKDVIYQQALLEGGTSDEEDEGPAGARAPPTRTYAQEQEELKKAFLTAFDDEAPGGGGEGEGFGSGVLKTKPRRKAAAAGRGDEEEEEEEDEEEEEEEVEEAKEGGGGQAGASEARVQQLLDGYFGRDELLSRDERFLKRYILHKGWVDEGDEGFSGDDGEEPHHHNMVDNEEEDEQFVQQAELFEHAYNFRFEEPGSAAIKTYPRNVEGTVRKEDERRKRKRQEKAERQAAEEEQRRAEVKRLKNLKKAEIEGKLEEIQTVAGKAAPRQELLDQLVAGDFDPEEYDRQMAAAFGDEYYGAGADEDGADDLADEEFERELEAMAKYGSEDEDPQTFTALHKRLAAQRKEEAAAGAAGADEGDADEGEGDEEAGDPEEAAKARAEVQRLLEEYFKLDYEDVVGGIPTRFRYKEVAPDTFGLDVGDILAMEDKDLNQVVGLRTLAPYREEHKKFRPNYQKINELKLQHSQGSLGQHARHGGGGGGGYGGGGGGKPYGSRQPHGKERGQGGGGGVWKPRPQGQGEGQQHRASVPEKSVAEKRLESYNKPVLMKKGKTQHGQQQQQQQQQQQRGEQQGGGGQKRKRDAASGGGDGGQQQKQKQAKPAQQQQQPQAAAAADGAQLSRAAKKNMKRAEKRAAKKPQGGGEGGEQAA